MLVVAWPNAKCAVALVPSGFAQGQCLLEACRNNGSRSTDGCRQVWGFSWNLKVEKGGVAAELPLVTIEAGKSKL